jgi:hypothetical protein
MDQEDGSGFENIWMRGAIGTKLNCERKRGRSFLVEGSAEEK